MHQIVDIRAKHVCPHQTRSECSQARVFSNALTRIICVRVTELRMTCFGRSYVHWSEVENVGHRGGRQRIETVEYSDNEDYFQYKFCLWQGGGELYSCTSCQQVTGTMRTTSSTSSASGREVVSYIDVHLVSAHNRLQGQRGLLLVHVQPVVGRW